MLAHEFMRNAFLAGTAIALACGLVGYFVVLRSQVFAGDAFSHVAFTGALAAAAAGVDIRLGLFAATILVAVGLGLLGERSRADDVVIGSVFAWILGLGVLFLSIFTASASGSNGTAAVRVLFGSIFGLSRLRCAHRRGDRDRGLARLGGDRAPASLLVGRPRGRTRARGPGASARDRLLGLACDRRRRGDAGRRCAAPARAAGGARRGGEIDHEPALEGPGAVGWPRGWSDVGRPGPELQRFLAAAQHGRDRGRHAPYLVAVIGRRLIDRGAVGVRAFPRPAAASAAGHDG